LTGIAGTGKLPTAAVVGSAAMVEKAIEEVAVVEGRITRSEMIKAAIEGNWRILACLVIDTRN